MTYEFLLEIYCIKSEQVSWLDNKREVRCEGIVGAAWGGFEEAYLWADIWLYKKRDKGQKSSFWTPFFKNFFIHPIKKVNNYQKNLFIKEICYLHE